MSRKEAKTLNAIKNKLQSKSGASIIIALLFFLICSVIGGIVLVSANANAGRLSHTRQEQQAYLTASSAVRLVREELKGLQFSHIIVVEETPLVMNIISDDTQLTAPPGKVVFSTQVESLANDVTNSRPLSPFAFTIEPPPDSGRDVLATVKGSMTISDSYDLTVVLAVEYEEGPSYEMTLSLPAQVVGPSDLITTEEVPPASEEEEMYLVTTTTTTTLVTWGPGTITKGGDSP